MFSGAIMWSRVDILRFFYLLFFRIVCVIILLLLPSYARYSRHYDVLKTCFDVIIRDEYKFEY